MNDRLSDILPRLGNFMERNANIQREYREAQADRRRAGNVRNVTNFIARHPESYAATQKRTHAKRHDEKKQSRMGVSPSLVLEADALADEWRCAAVWSCSYCGKPATRRNRTVDHVIALSNGGKHTPSNIKPACKRCNSRKNARTLWFA